MKKNGKMTYNYNGKKLDRKNGLTSIKYLVLIVLLGFVYYSNAQTTAPCLEIDSIQTEYAINDDISFNFRNNCDDRIIISISLEKWVNDRWLLFAEDIFQIPSIHKVENAILLKENEIDRKEKWKIKRKMYRKGNDNTYRFRYNIRKTYQELITTEYSNVFHVKKR